jgi:uncharacterized coiled-coil protein SlyX
MSVAKLNERIRHLEEINTRQAEKIGTMTRQLTSAGRTIEELRRRLEIAQGRAPRVRNSQTGG